jgi:hypothetical protein
MSEKPPWKDNPELVEEGREELRKRREHRRRSEVFDLGDLGIGPNGPDIEPSPEYDERAPPPSAAILDEAEPIDFGIVLPSRELLAKIKPRPWLYGNLLQRGYVSVFSGISGGGKTTLALTVGVELASRRPVLEHTLWRPECRVWYCNLDDPIDEIFRRLKAILLHHEITEEALADRFMVSGRNPQFIIAKKDQEQNVIAAPVKEALIKELKYRQIDVLIVDPYIRTHRATENSNDDMAAVMQLWIDVAEASNTAILLLHHVRKGLVDADDQQASRGAGAIIDLARVCSMLATMTVKDAELLNINPNQRRWHFCIGSAKASMAPPPFEREWYRLISVDIGNADADYPAGDNVQAVERWRPKPLFNDLSNSVINSIFDELRKGPEPGEQYSPTRREKSNERWAGDVIAKLSGKNLDQANEILKAWISTGVLIADDYTSPARRAPRAGITLNEAKAAEIVGRFAVLEPEC